jgi:uncharacterized protein YdaL
MLEQLTICNLNKVGRVFAAAACVALMLLFMPTRLYAADAAVKKVLIVVEGNGDIHGVPMASGRQLANLLGHFRAQYTIVPVTKYTSHQLNKYDFTFYLGDTFKNPVPNVFLQDVYYTGKTVVWFNTGFIEFSRAFDLQKKFGFHVSNVDSVTFYDTVKSKGKVFTKLDGTIEVIRISNQRQVSVLATAYSSAKKTEMPYIVKSKNLYYFADSPFSYATSTDRYLLMADMLHDILGENHRESHPALIRIEDISAMDNPEKLRQIADLLYRKHIPFLVGVIPFYVNPGTGVRLSLSERPEMVEALKYMVQKGATIVMHGSTHQYKGTTAADYEFWDAMTNQPIKGETKSGIENKLDAGIRELVKCGLYPLLWETPHYTASFLLYQTVPEFFSSAMEPRLAIENAIQSQYFPYIINHDVFGERIYPENMGYVPFSSDKEVSREAVRNILKSAAAIHQVRDGFAACFFHEFLDLDLLDQLTNGITALGFTYIDMKQYAHTVKLGNNFIILTGTQHISLQLQDEYLVESIFKPNGELKEQKYSSDRITGKIEKTIELQPGEIYVAKPAEVREHKVSFMEKVKGHVQKFLTKVIPIGKRWKESRPVILWNHHSLGEKFRDQASLAAVFRSLNIRVDTIFVGQSIDLKNYNLLIAPAAALDSLKQDDIEQIISFVSSGGNIITDGKSALAGMLGIRFASDQIMIRKVRDHYFPEEHITWPNPVPAFKFEPEYDDIAFCYDDVTKFPLIIGRNIDKGKMIFISSLFDPYTQRGYSLYPYLMIYMQEFLNLHPIVRRNKLETYFDPGFRTAFSVESLVSQWVEQGIHIVHAAAWHVYPKFTYDYKRLIDLAHANGILVYAWVEPPQVSQAFYNTHPEWREKNYLNHDVRPSWRYPVALTDDACLNAATTEYLSILNRYDWDGVNLAELYFEAGRGFEDAELFTPMHPSAKSEFKKLHGFDPEKLFDQSSRYYWKTNTAAKNSFVNYRAEKLSRIYDHFLGEFSKFCSKKNGFDLMVTCMDSYGSPELRENIGVDMNNIIALQNKYKFRLQIEDPENRWSSDPDRYYTIGRLYQKKIQDSSLLSLDLNILNFREQDSLKAFSTTIQTGVESYLLINAAARGAGRFTIYSEASINQQDLALLPYAAAAQVQYSYIDGGMIFNSPYSFTIKLPSECQEILLDGNTTTSFRDNSFFIPAGIHKVIFSNGGITGFSTREFQTKILSFTGNVLAASYGIKDLKIIYAAEGRNILTLNQAPTAIKIDGNYIDFTVMKGNDCYSVFLPPGKHTAEITLGNDFSFGVNFASLWSSVLIATFGFFAVTTLMIMYMWVKLTRKKFVS